MTSKVNLEQQKAIAFSNLEPVMCCSVLSI